MQAGRGDWWLAHCVVQGGGRSRQQAGMLCGNHVCWPPAHQVRLGKPLIDAALRGRLPACLACLQGSALPWTATALAAPPAPAAAARAPRRDSGCGCGGQCSKASESGSSGGRQLLFDHSLMYCFI